MWVLLLVVLFIALLFAISVVAIILARLTIRARSGGVLISPASLVRMKLRKIDPAVIVDCLIMARLCGLEVATGDLEAHYLAGGNVERVVQALIAASKTGIGLDFQRAAAIDLAGHDVLEAAQATAIEDRAAST